MATQVHVILWGKWPRGWWRQWTRTAHYHVRQDEALAHVDAIHTLLRARVGDDLDFVLYSDRDGLDNVLDPRIEIQSLPSDHPFEGSGLALTLADDTLPTGEPT